MTVEDMRCLPTHLTHIDVQKEQCPWKDEVLAASSHTLSTSFRDALRIPKYIGLDSVNGESGQATPHTSGRTAEQAALTSSPP